ncbi:DUF1284 domain-containing protein [Thermodesulfobacterium sp. TA1]|uniref:DUF1284 domain-containing protein n=1 Tax=Thermodesulfobacterium sp. TA1 TaxID=2234087 RepID=UPI00123247E8|nr:DUF1284 domain-containing protein [Thermodesulfobacterium sp. TA1]QER41917.1 DUF1284 domain-containing protein [Thermodesulfobacterium sp. TA1]
MNNSLHLRGHHLICLQFYKGLGYDASFVKNLNRVVKAWEKTPALIVEGPDMVCKSCPYLEGEKCALSDKIDQKDLLALNLLKVQLGVLIEKQTVKNKLYEIWEVWKEKACKDCLWNEVCSEEVKTKTKHKRSF